MPPGPVAVGAAVGGAVGAATSSGFLASGIEPAFEASTTSEFSPTSPAFLLSSRMALAPIETIYRYQVEKSNLIWSQTC